MKKELYEKPEIEVISLLNVDIITESAEEGGDVPVEDDENANNLNEVDLSPWAEDEAGNEQGGITDIIDDIKDALTPGDNTPEETPIEEDITTPSENIQEEIPVEENIDNIE